MIVVLNHEGYFISRLHEPSEEDFARPDVFEAPESDMLNNNGNWSTELGLPLLWLSQSLARLFALRAVSPPKISL